MFLTFVSALLRKWNEYIMARRTQHELNSLSNRDLADLGISRGDIEFISRKNATEFYNASASK